MNIIPYLSRFKLYEKATAYCSRFKRYVLLVGGQPLLDLGFGQTLNGLFRVGRILAAVAIYKVQAFGSLEQGFLVAGGIAERTDSALLDQSSGLGIILLLADDLLHGMNLLSFRTQYASYYTCFCVKIK